MAKNMGNPINETLPITSFRITGWSAKYKGDSLLSYLTGFGSLVSFTHFPQLNTTYVAIQVTKYKVSFSKAIANLIPRARVELGEFWDTAKAERELENPDVTALISSQSFFSEVDIYEMLKFYGSIRALNFGFSQQYNKWYCKASFYETFSLNQLLNSNSTTLGILCDGKNLKIEKLQKCVGQQASKIIKKSELFIFKKRTEKHFTSINKMQQKGVTHQNSRDKQALAKDRGNIRVSRSCSRNPINTLPSVSIFNSKILYIENVLRILKSKANENKIIHINTVRSKSIDCSYKKESKLEFTLPCLKGRKGINNSYKNTFSFADNELLFLDIGQKVTPKFYVPTNRLLKSELSEVQHGENSFLSQSDVSEGYTTFEENTYCMPVAETICMANGSQSSAKDPSLIVLTQHSSDAEHNLPTNLYNLTNSPKISNIDHLFGSYSGHTNNQVFSRPVLVSSSSHKQDVAYFAYPCV